MYSPKFSHIYTIIVLNLEDPDSEIENWTLSNSVNSKGKYMHYKSIVSSKVSLKDAFKSGAPVVLWKMSALSSKITFIHTFS